ncbi:ABC transporter substrate-binding protein [Paenibacillus pectinilyticus]|uniref:ABC transporter substrate-binding protein n=1 Tax=Paenibacillus pectinilyticus TaxID=512399 RepID=A0A1C1A4W1_9BACL|nr:extracellular solute-binding protein [Paenibacillus pectinilyticus]OCT15589.1 ABC transporter substrate-binding protein [Paenibacillus pectinilyticus]
MKKTLVATTSICLLATLLAACGSDTTTTTTSSSPDTKATAAPTAAAATEAPKTANANDDIKGKIVFATNRTDLIDTKLKEYREAFKKKFPNADVEFEAVKDYEAAIKLRMATADMPDVILIPNIPNAQLPDYFAPLDDLGLNDKIRFKDYKAANGNTYGLVTGGSTTGIVYNKKAFADAGITSLPKTLDEFYAASDKLKAKGIVPLATNYKDKWPLYTWQHVAVAMSGNPNFWNDRIKQDNAFDPNGAFAKSLGILKTMISKGYVEKDINSSNWEQSKKDVASGKMAMYLLPNWVIPQVIENGTDSANVGFFPMPFDNSGKLTTLLTPDYFYAVSKNSKNLKTAKAFVKWLIEDSGYDDFAGFIPSLKDKKSSITQLSDFLATKDLNFVEIAADNSDAMAIQNKAQIDLNDIAQEVAVTDVAKVFDKYNKKWEEAKKALGK